MISPRTPVSPVEQLIASSEDFVGYMRRFSMQSLSLQASKMRLVWMHTASFTDFDVEVRPGKT